MERCARTSASETARAARQHRGVPIVGRAPAGALMLAEQNVEGWVRLPREFLRRSTRDYFLVRIRAIR